MWDHAVEPMILAGGLAAITSRIKIYGSVPILAVNPAIAARQAATLSDISGGRFGLNIVSGWAEAQYSQMGAWPGDSWYGDRYKGAAEYVTILKQLWETGVSDFKGEFFSMDDCRLGPLPPHPIEVVCAGQSDTGMAFTAEYGDYAFINGEGGAEGLRNVNDRLLAAAAKTGRDVGSYVTQIVIIRDSDEEAADAVAAIRAGADLPALERITGQAVLDQSGSTSARLSAEIEKLRDKVFFNLDVIAGSPATIAAYLDELGTVEGTAGVMLIFEDVDGGIDRFAREVAPLMSTPSSVAATVAS
jgi:pyrimidine oxygenase